MQRSRSIRALILAIDQLPADRPRNTPGKWYRTQKEHWLGWLGEYHTRGFYGRKSHVRRDARYAYNHIVEVKMLIWLSKAAGISRGVLTKAISAQNECATLPAKSGAYRKVVTWEDIEARLWR
jgi:hypothetical protein